MKKLIPAAIIFVILVHISLFSIYGWYDKYESQFYESRSATANMLDKEFNLSKQPSLLYLEPGDAAYFFHANSSCRMVAPLVLVRYRDNWNTTNLPQYWEEYNCIANYHGKYIVMELGGDVSMDWFGDNQTVRKPLMDFIKGNYTVVANKAWRIWERNNST
jgi:hypothetical protein